MSDPALMLLTAVSLAAIATVVVFIVVIWKIKGMAESMSRRVDETFRELTSAAEEVRKAAEVSRDILVHAERAAENVSNVTDGLRSLRRTLDAANAVLDHVAAPVLGTVAGGIAGVKAAATTVVNRFMKKEGADG